MAPLCPKTGHACITVETCQIETTGQLMHDRHDRLVVAGEQRHLSRG